MTGTNEPCPFCERIASGSFGQENEHAVAIPDRFPVTRGHTLVLPRRHVGVLDHLSRDESVGLVALSGDVRAALAGAMSPDGFNIGINEGAAAGQTIEHIHIHVIPRFRGDVDDPRGGVRWVVPDKAAYWSQ